MGIFDTSCRLYSQHTASQLQSFRTLHLLAISRGLCAAYEGEVGRLSSLINSSVHFSDNIETGNAELGPRVVSVCQIPRARGHGH